MVFIQCSNFSRNYLSPTIKLRRQKLRLQSVSLNQRQLSTLNAFEKITDKWLGMQRYKRGLIDGVGLVAKTLKNASCLT